MSTGLVLYSYYKSSCTWRVRAALAYKGLEYTTKLVNVANADNMMPAYLKLNPSGNLPTLIHNGQVLTESMAILEYLEEVFPDRKQLLPTDPITRAKIRTICSLIVVGIQPLQTPKVYQHSGRTERFAVEMTVLGLHALEDQLKSTAGTHCVGNEMSLADIVFVPQLHNAVTKFKIKLDNLPIVKKLYANLREHDCFATTHPTKQPDAQASDLSSCRSTTSLTFNLGKSSSDENNDTFGKE
ncbi:unnamed protein product [Bursaphelenchus okinawaensis]|uniref:maleylacetoacetate isomerase n=1 Tax=Bursaphelenchus okinawaensis TaxID=465554 RepID=A0A811JV96_9BILA|nr:unnamed protein product [Bursaphelenchus okinawaensis]CAG9084695.1 unnamed protein product [Bursaphelenchus okinawaensis]